MLSLLTVTKVDCTLAFTSNWPGVTSQTPHTPGGWPAGNNLPCLPSARTLAEWRPNQTNRTPTSPFPTANHLARIRTHNLRRNHDRLRRQRSIEIWQLHRWDNRPEAVSLYISFFSRTTIHCEPGVATVKKQPFEVKPFRQHEQKEKGLEDWKR